MSEFLGSLGGGLLGLGVSTKLAKYVSYLLFAIGGIYGVIHFKMLWQTTEANGGQGMSTLIPENLDPIVGIWIVLGMVTMMIGMLWILWLPYSLPSSLGKFFSKKYPQNILVKILTSTISYLALGAIIYWANWVGIINNNTSRNFIYVLIIAFAITLLIYLTPLKGIFQEKANNWGWAKKYKAKEASRRITGLQKEVVKLETSLKEAREELGNAIKKTEVKNP